MMTLAAALLRLLPAEAAHRATIAALKTGLAPRAAPPTSPRLAARVLGMDFPHPIGLAAGFDKNADVPDAMLGLGFAFVEIGTVTPRPQGGNPKPRIFRLPADRAVINRLGFNNEGMERVRARLVARQGRPGIVGVNIGANKETVDRAADYVAAFRALGALGSYVTINVSSPNTPGLRGLQDKDALTELLGRLNEERNACGATQPLLLKIAPDLDAEALAAIAEIALAGAVDGLIVSNTTIERPQDLKSPARTETGGLSGRPLFALSTRRLAEIYRLTAGRVKLIGVGGVASGADAYQKIRAGASLVQLYTAMTYEGPGLAARIARELDALLAADGIEKISDAVGRDAATIAARGRG
ncbi:MAG: quinone-dependent dihydroorotate dehydrogenase [Alphaproteobacteria bacterium]|nr:quinone-dependent dihydroorotate dehydrogenase [Alphaproteobacteria bacterium]